MKYLTFIWYNITITGIREVIRDYRSLEIITWGYV